MVVSELTSPDLIDFTVGVGMSEVEALSLGGVSSVVEDILSSYGCDLSILSKFVVEVIRNRLAANS